jgi:hypothetical protein
MNPHICGIITERNHRLNRIYKLLHAQLSQRVSANNGTSRLLGALEDVAACCDLLAGTVLE